MLQHSPTLINLGKNQILVKNINNYHNLCFLITKLINTFINNYL